MQELQGNDMDNSPVSIGNTKTFCLDYWARAKQIILHPKTFYAEMPTSVSLAEPLSFYAVAAAVNSLIMSGLNPFQAVTLFFTSIVGVLVAALIGNFLAQTMGGASNFQTTLRVYAYAGVCLLFFWLNPLNWLAGLYQFVLYLIGLKQTHQISTAKAVIAALASGWLTVMILWLGSCVMVIRKIFPF